MSEFYGKEVQGVGKIGYDMDADGTVEFVNRNLRKSKIDQVIDFYGIPYFKKDDRRAYLKYRIQERHCGIVNDYFLSLFRATHSEEANDFDFAKIQKEYLALHPEAEHTGMNIKINYELFKEKDQQHTEALTAGKAPITGDQANAMMGLMQQMMTEMAALKELKTGSLSPNIPNQNANNSNTSETTTSEKTGEVGQTMEGSSKQTTGGQGESGSTGVDTGGEHPGESTVSNSITAGEPKPLSSELTGNTSNSKSSEPNITEPGSGTDIGLTADEAAAIIIPDGLTDKIEGIE